jgi:hypothetical protein
MAHKKFYYQNGGGKPSQKDARDSAASQNKQHNNISQAGLPEANGASLESLSLSENTAALLLKNNFKSIADITAKSEKDMYRIQGFNKKMLGEVVQSLNKVGLTLKENSAPNPAFNKDSRNGTSGKPDTLRRKNENGNERNKITQPNKTGGSDNIISGGKFPRANPTGQKFKQDANPKGGKNNKRRAAEEEPAREKLTAPLPVDEWRKIQKGGKWGFYDGFKIVIPAMYDEVFCFKDGLASVEISEKCGYIDCDNNVVIPLDYETAMSFSENLASVVKNGKCGYINKNNETVIPFEYDAATPFEGGEAKIKKDGKWGTITPDGAVKWI